MSILITRCGKVVRRNSIYDVQIHKKVLSRQNYITVTQLENTKPFSLLCFPFIIPLSGGNEINTVTLKHENEEELQQDFVKLTQIVKENVERL